MSLRLRYYLAILPLFAGLGLINSVLVYLAAHDIQLPYRLRGGPAKGELVWRPPNRYTLKEMLTNPAYAGAYVYGRRMIDPRRHRVLKAPHPSPLSAWGGFFGSRPFSAVNQALSDRGQAPIDWSVVT